MRIAELHESPFTFKERLLFAFVAGLFSGILVALVTVYLIERFLK